MAVTIQIRRDQAADWTTANPTLAQGEWGYELDTAKRKIGDGVTAWIALPYYSEIASGLPEPGTLDGQVLRWEDATDTWDATSSMVINDAGNVGIGTTSPGVLLHLQNVAGGTLLRMTDNATTTFNLGYTPNTDVFLDSVNNDPMLFKIGSAERMRIDTVGNVGIGIASGLTSKLNVETDGTEVVQFIGTNAGAAVFNFRNKADTDIRLVFRDSANAQKGALYYALASDSMEFITNSSERMRIDSSGNVLIGQTSATTVTGGAPRLSSRGVDGGNTNWELTAHDSGGTQDFGVRNDGAIYMPGLLASALNQDVQLSASGYLNTVSSSIRYKKDVRDYTHGLAEVMAMRPVWYTSNQEGDSTEEQAGVIAEEMLDAGLSEYVFIKDNQPESVKYSRLCVVLLKAIQELTARVETLEGAL